MLSDEGAATGTLLDTKYDVREKYGIPIPSGLTNVLTEYTKAVLAAQPDDIYKWSAKYFEELSKRQDQSATATQQQEATRTSIHRTKVLAGLDDVAEICAKLPVSQDGLSGDNLSVSTIKNELDALGYSPSTMENLCTLGGFEEKCSRTLFIATACVFVAEGFEDSMLKACQVIGGGDKGQVPIGHFKEILGFLATCDGRVDSDRLEYIHHYGDQVAFADGMVPLEQLLSNESPLARPNWR